MLVKDHLDQPVNRVQVRLVERQLFKQGMESEELPCPDSANSQSDGLAVFICNTPREGIRAVLKVRRRRRTCCLLFFLCLFIVVFFCLLLGTV